ncbi:MAG TPA: hypothetical protein VLY63_14855 [Anaerolineae bacterium]|nr:hypothetical protein [Anaerolineae bacterium]
MDLTTVTLHTKFEIGSVDPRMFGGFLEHLGRAVYEGVYDPGSSHADQDGFRTDVMDALRRLDLIVMRYPGGELCIGLSLVGWRRPGGGPSGGARSGLAKPGAESLWHR